MPNIYFMNYNIYFNDPIEYNTALAASGGVGLILRTPRQAAADFGIPFPYPSGPITSNPKGITFFAPFTPGAQFMFPGPTGVFVDDTILTTIIIPQTGNPPSIWPPNALNAGSFTWSGNLTLTANVETPPINPIAQRRWVGGRETCNFLEGGNGIIEQAMSRDASRTIDGLGYPIRGTYNPGIWTRNIADYRAGLITNVSWERIYVRVRHFPTTNNVPFWWCHGFPSANAGFTIKVMTNGTFEGFDVNGGAGQVSAGTIFTPELNKWYRFDIFLKYDSGGGTSGIIKIYLNGTPVFSFVNTTGQGMNSNTRHVSTEIGRTGFGITDNDFELDLDDWINSDLPSNVSPSTLTFNDANYSLDWLLGSHVKLQYTDSLSQVNWTAGIGKGVVNLGIDTSNRLATANLVSTTSGARLEGLTDTQLQSVHNTIYNDVGAVAAIIGLMSTNSGSTDGQLGYKIAGGVDVLATINQLNSENPNTVAYLPSGMILPTEISPLSVVHTKSTDANTDTSVALLAAVEYLGVFGVEDDPTWQFPVPAIGFLHNCRYPNTIYGFFGSQPPAPVYAVGGTYAGNSTYQEVTLPDATHFLIIRATSGAPTAPIIWFGASLGAHNAAGDIIRTNLRVWFDSSSGTYKFSVVGTNININQTGVTYQYIAFCDPGMRYNICGAFAHSASVTSPQVNNLVAADFLADGGFLQREVDQISADASGLFFKGPANGANSAIPLTNAQPIDNNICNFAAGILNSFSSLHSAGTNSDPNIDYSLWRLLDSGIDGCVTNVMIQILQYTGNGSNPRNIPLTPTSGRFPLLVIVMPVASSTTFFRDPSHAGANSTNFQTAALSTLAITGVAIDQITVNSALNANGTVYEVFVITGDTAGMNNGTFFPSYCQGDGPWVDPNLSGDIVVLADGGLILDGDPGTTLLKDISGIYTLITGKRNDTLMDRQTGQTSVDVEIPDPIFKTGYIGG